MYAFLKSMNNFLKVTTYGVTLRICYLATNNVFRGFKNNIVSTVHKQLKQIKPFKLYTVHISGGSYIQILVYGLPEIKFYTSVSKTFTGVAYKRFRSILLNICVYLNLELNHWLNLAQLSLIHI